MACRFKYLYSIVNPEDDSVIYIGQTYHPRQRYTEHLRGKLDVDRWMREMFSRGIKPELKVISRHRTKINQCERSMIAKAKRQSTFLLNKL